MYTSPSSVRTVRGSPASLPSESTASPASTAPAASEEPVALSVLALRALIARADPRERAKLLQHPVIANVALQHSVRVTDGMRVHEVSAIVDVNAADAGDWHAARDILYAFRMRGVGCAAEGTQWRDNATSLQRAEPLGVITADEALGRW